MPNKIDPIRRTGDGARAQARALLAGARFAALAVNDPATGAPLVSRVALGLSPEGAPVTLVSTLAAHTAALRADPRAALLVGEPGPKGDPLTHPRLSLQARARFVARGSAEDAAVRAPYLAANPKARLYADFADFAFVHFEITAAVLNGGFGKAFHLTPADIGL